MITNMCRIVTLGMAFVLVAGGRGAEIALADSPAIDHPPHPAGGIGSDTDYIDYFSGLHRSTWIADDFVLPSNQQLKRLRWWGFYILDNPPAIESFRVRIHNANGPNSLPGTIVFDDTFTGISRSATGRTIILDQRVREFVYELELSTPIPLVGDQTQWLEIASVGDIDTSFYWEFSLADRNGYAAQDTIFAPDWILDDVDADAAFQLYAIPEPATFALLAAGSVVPMTRRMRRDSPAA